MSRNVRLSLMALIMVILVLAIAIPVFAEDIYVEKQGPCYLLWPAYTENGDVVSHFGVKGHFVLVRTDTQISNTCSGIVPYGEDFVWLGSKETWFTFDQICEAWDSKSCKKDDLLVLTYEDLLRENHIEDPITKEVYSTKDWILTAQPNGEFEMVTEYFFP